MRSSNAAVSASKAARTKLRAGEGTVGRRGRSRVGKQGPVPARHHKSHRNARLRAMMSRPASRDGQTKMSGACKQLARARDGEIEQGRKRACSRQGWVSAIRARSASMPGRCSALIAAPARLATSSSRSSLSSAARPSCISRRLSKGKAGIACDALGSTARDHAGWCACG